MVIFPFKNETREIHYRISILFGTAALGHHWWLVNFDVCFELLKVLAIHA
jgi:hypothetical protein